MMDENSAGCASEALVETVARAMYDAQAARTRLICPAWDAAASEWKREWRGHARAAIAALPAPTISQDVPAPAAECELLRAYASELRSMPVARLAYIADWLDTYAARLTTSLSAATPLQSDLAAENARLRTELREIAEHADTRRQDGIQMGATIWRIALDDIAREARAALQGADNHD